MAPRKQDGCLNSRWLLEFKMAARVQDGCQNSRWLPELKMAARIQDGFKNYFRKDKSYPKMFGKISFLGSLEVEENM